MREVSEVAEKGPGADPRRLSNREKTLLIDRLRPAYSPGSMTCLPGIAPGGHHSWEALDDLLAATYAEVRACDKIGRAHV